MRRRRIAHRVSHERWLVSYADFITLLFAFFTTLYAISTVDQRKAGKLVMSMMQALHVDFFPVEDPGQGPSTPITRGAARGVSLTEAAALEQARKNDDARREAERLSKLRQLAGEMEQFVVMAQLDGKVSVRMEHRGVVLSLNEAGFFESGSARLMPGARAALDKLTRRLGDRPDLAVAVEGHTDDRPVRGGQYASNWELSTARATFVVAYLMDKGVEPRRLSAAGYAEHRPVSDNATADGRSRNRRVDLVLQEMPPPAEEATASGPATAAAPALPLDRPAEPADLPSGTSPPLPPRSSP